MQNARSLFLVPRRFCCRPANDRYPSVTPLAPYDLCQTHWIYLQRDVLQGSVIRSFEFTALPAPSDARNIPEYLRPYLANGWYVLFADSEDHVSPAIFDNWDPANPLRALGLCYMQSGWSKDRVEIRLRCSRHVAV